MPELTTTSLYHLRQERLSHAIEAAGLDGMALNGKFFIHRTGHGLGMVEHEEPYIRSDNTQILSPGTTFTVEPGIYLSERGGVRIEDNVVVTESGSESLSILPRELKVVG